MSVLQDRWAVVTGASSGLGSDFARGLAARGCNLVLVARREDRLEQLSDELKGGSGVETRVVAMSLSEPDAPATLHTRLADEGLQVDVLVNNAGFGVHGSDLSIPWQREHELLQLNIVALVQLTKLFAADMVERRFGYVLQVASTGAYQPTPSYAAYGASKAFVLNYGEALACELRGTGVVVSVLSPGVTRTEFMEVAGHRVGGFQRANIMESRVVAEDGIECMLKGQISRIPGISNRATAVALRLMPRTFQARLAHALLTASDESQP